MKCRKSTAWKTVAILCVALWFVASAFPQDDPSAAARAELDAGMQSFNEANYEAAIGHFEQATTLAPELNEAHLYLAASYAQMFVPGLDNPDNVVWATKALKEYSDILERHPSDIDSIKGTAYLYAQLRNFSAARENYRKAIALNPRDPELFYAAGVTDWSIAERDSAAEAAKLDAEDDDALMKSSGCSDLRATTLANVEDGIAMMNKAMDLRKEYQEAMTYMNLLYQLRANMECGNKQAQEADLKKADEWADLALATKKKRAEASSNHGDIPPQ